MKNKTKLIVFDLDGTLVDSMSDFADQAAFLMEKHYGIPRKEGWARYMDTSGLPFYQQLETLFPGDEKNAAVSARFEAWKIENIANSPLHPGVTEIFQNLKAMGFMIAISSNNMQPNVDRIIRDHKLIADAVLGFREAGFQKGESHFLWLEKHLECSRSQMLFVGDSRNDCRIARRCNVPFLAFPGTFSLVQFREVDPEVRHINRIDEVMEALSTKS